MTWIAERARGAIDRLAWRGIEPRWIERLDLRLARWLCDAPEIGR
jgi:hypothetical protein